MAHQMFVTYCRHDVNDFFSPLCGAATHKVCRFGIGEEKALPQFDDDPQLFFFTCGIGLCVDVCHDKCVVASGGSFLVHYVLKEEKNFPRGFATFNPCHLNKQRPWRLIFRRGDVKTVASLNTALRNGVLRLKVNQEIVPRLIPDRVTIVNILLAHHEWEELMTRTLLSFVDGTGTRSFLDGFRGVVHGSSHTLYSGREMSLRVARFRVDAFLDIISIQPTTEKHHEELLLHKNNNWVVDGIVFGKMSTTHESLGEWWNKIDDDLESIIRFQLNWKTISPKSMFVTLPRLHTSGGADTRTEHLLMGSATRLRGLYSSTDTTEAFPIKDVSIQTLAQLQMNEIGVMISKNGEATTRQRYRTCDDEMLRFTFESPGIFVYVIDRSVLGMVVFHGKEGELRPPLIL